LSGRSGASATAISPDGKSCAYSGTDQDGIKHLYLSRFDRFDTQAITSGENIISPFFSPDGNWIGYFNGRALKKVSVSGGTPILLCEARGYGSAHWAENNEIVYSTGRGIVKVNAAGGATDTLLSMDVQGKEVEYRNPYVLPDKESVLYTVRVEQGWRTDVIDLITGKKKELIDRGISARYAPTGHLIYQDWNEEALFVIPFDVDQLEITGPPHRVVEQMRYIRSGASDYHFSENGSLIYSTLGNSNGGEVCWVDKKGVITMISDLPGQYVQPRISPDGKKLVLRKIGTHCQLWIYDIERGTLSLLTMEGDNHDPLWTPDSRHIVFFRAEYGITSIFWQRADGSGGAQLLAKSTGFNPRLSSLTGKNPQLLFNEDNPSTGSDVLMLSFDKNNSISPILQERSNETGASLSPDGRWLTYTSDESGQEDVYLRPFPGSGAKILVSKGGGTNGKWAPDGKSVYYRIKNKMMRVPVTYDPEFSIGAPEQLFEGDLYFSGILNYDISPEGERFVMIYAKRDATNAQNYRIVLNWFDELKRLAAN
jgi:serine/threonine-protein kinase